MSTIDVLLIPADEAAPVEVRTIEPTLEAYYAILSVDIVEAIEGLGWLAFVDEEGKFNGSQPNPRATVLAKILGWSNPDVLFGDVIFLGPDEASWPEYWSVETVTAALKRVGL